MKIWDDLWMHGNDGERKNASRAHSYILIFDQNPQLHRWQWWFYYKWNKFSSIFLGYRKTMERNDCSSSRTYYRQSRWMLLTNIKINNYIHMKQKIKIDACRGRSSEECIILRRSLSNNRVHSHLCAHK